MKKDKDILICNTESKLLKKLDSRVSMKLLTEEFGIGMITMYDIEKQKDELVKYYA